VRNLPTFRIQGLAAATLLGVSLATFVGFSGQALAAQPESAAQKKEDTENAELLRDFIHFTRINRTDVAAGFGRKLLDKKLPNVKFVELVEKSGEADRFADTIGKALRVGELEATAANLLNQFEQGKLERVRNADEIKRNIEMLDKGQRPKMYARERLVAAGEYAVPQLLAALLDRRDPIRKAESQRLLVDMGQQAVVPLSTALVALDDSGKELVADVLGLIGHRTSTPFLMDVLLSSKSPNVKQACERALSRIGPSGTTSDPAELYRDLGESYYAEKPELTSFPGEPFQLLWVYNPAIGLTMSAIRTEVYHEAMAMRMAERSMTLRESGNDGAVALWLASNFSREIQTPAGYDNPAYPKTKRDAMYFAVVAGAGPSQSVLARGLDTKNTPLARRAIAAIEQTAGGSAMRNDGVGEGGRRPLIEALRYPNRRVQYEAALALGRSQPDVTFSGSERVVPLMASAIRDASARFAVVLTSDRELGAGYRRTLERAGYTVLPVGAQLSDVAAPISETPGIDLIVSNMTLDSTNSMLTDVRANPKLGATPILVLLPTSEAIDLARKYDRDPMIAVRGRGINESQLTEAASQLVESASGGPIKPEEARDYSARSLAVLRDLAVSGNTTLDVSEASLPLIAALGESTGKTRLDVAEVLARINQKRVQVALMDAAMNASGDERILLMNKVADSAKRFGNQLELRQIKRVTELATTAPDKEATAAAALIGSLNLSNTNLVPMILGKGG